MPVFEYKAIDKKSKEPLQSQVEADDLEDAFRILDKKEMAVIWLKEKKSRGKISITSPAFLNRVSAKNLVVFSRQFAVMLKASVPVVQALRILVKQTSNPRLKIIISDVADEVDGGVKLSQALAKHKRVFSNFFVAMIKSGETSGRLDEVLDYLADQQEKDYDLMSKIKGAMIYPAFIVFGLFVVGIIMMTVVVPKLTAVLQETGGELPTSTKALIAISGFFQGFWWLVILIVVLFFVGLKLLSRTVVGKKYLDWLVVKVPIFGKLFKYIYLVRFTRSLGTLSTGGIPLVDALKITSQVVGNAVFRRLVDLTVKEVEEGNPVSSVFLNSRDMPVMVSYMISVGEQTGHLDIVLEKLSDFYTRETDNMVANLVSLIEPIIMVVLGVAVGLMVAAIIMPMYNLASSF